VVTVRARRFWGRLLVLAATAVAAGCERDTPLDAAPDLATAARDAAWVAQPRPEPDFALVDLNPVSSSYNTSCSPRQHLGRISAWYFGHAT
jgi:hypothetical protein